MMEQDILLKRLWPRQQESNLYFTLRRHMFYPLNYGEYMKSWDGVKLVLLRVY